MKFGLLSIEIGHCKHLQACCTRMCLTLSSQEAAGGASTWIPDLLTCLGKGEPLCVCDATSGPAVSTKEVVHEALK